MTFPFKAGSPCPTVSLNSASTTPNTGSSPSAGPASSGGAASMLSITPACGSCSTSCCSNGGGSGPAGGPGPVGDFGPGGGVLAGGGMLMA
jgi:hypothetical protein